MQLAFPFTEMGFTKLTGYFNNALKDMSSYYKNNSLKPKPNITQAYTFHQRNTKTKRIIRVIWEGVQIENIEHTKHHSFTKFEHGIKRI
jgi:hypothetical protein